METGGHFGTRMTPPGQAIDEAIGEVKGRHVIAIMDGDCVELRCKHCSWVAHFSPAWTSQALTEAWSEHIEAAHAGAFRHAE